MTAAAAAAAAARSIVPKHVQAVRLTVLRTPLSLAARQAYQHGIAATACASLPPLPVRSALPFGGVRTFRTSAFCKAQGSWAKKGPISYGELEPITAQPSGEVTIIDVREPDEVAAGMIPSAVSVPLTQFEKAFDPNGGANFQRDFAFPRPGFDDQLVFYCRSGKRSAQAQEIARRNGWNNSRNYEGSWLDWVAHKEKGGK